MNSPLQTSTGTAPSVAVPAQNALPFLLGGWAVVIAALALLPHPMASSTELSTLRLGIPLWAVVPFVATLGAAALLPLVAPHAWENNRNKAILCAALAVPTALYLGMQGVAGQLELFEKSREYVAFITLIGTLFVLSGGVYVRGSLSGTPLLNTAMLGIGAVLASIVGTTGASMLLIRPLLRANAAREDKAHIVVFFIFVVSNCGGLLTPLGDPPLFLGFLKGVPFLWTFQQLLPTWALVNGALLILFLILDRVIFAREEARRPGSQAEEVRKHEPLRLDGAWNLALFAVLVVGIFASGQGLGTAGEPWPFGALEGLLLGCAALSAFATSKKVHEENQFQLGPLAEVAILFAAIFVTMIPALLILNRAAPTLGLTEPLQYFWATGFLSSVLDNAPTYLSFAATAAGRLGHLPEGRFIGDLLAMEGGPALIRAISAGAVLMGAMTYVGNGPNFIVKAIAESSGVQMPGFFRYIGWALVCLLPIVALAAFTVI